VDSPHFKHSKVSGHASYPETLTRTRPTKKTAAKNTTSTQGNNELSSFSLRKIGEGFDINFEPKNKIFGEKSVEIAIFPCALGF
jgi:hypothetical protein